MLDARRLNWSSLEFKASKLGLTATARVELAVVDSAAAEKELPQPASGTPTGARGAETLRVDLTSSFLGRRSLDRLWLDPANAAALGSVVIDSGKRKRMKAVRFTPQGVFARRVTPKDTAERSLAPEGWSKKSEAFYPYPLVVDAVTEPAALICLLAVSDPESFRGGKDLVVFSRNQLSRVTLELMAPVDVTVDYEVRTEKEVEQVRGRVSALQLAIRARPLQPDGNTNFELLGLVGDIELLVDRVGRWPLQLKGRVPPVGTVAVRLKKVDQRLGPDG